jgi:DNA-binding XRE family transcriptional regulator
MRPQLDPEKLKQLRSFEDDLTEHYGPQGSPTRLQFEAESRAWYLGEVLRWQRKDLHMTQKELADRIGKKRSYISKLERGETDMQLSTFLLISRELGLHFSQTVA